MYMPINKTMKISNLKPKLKPTLKSNRGRVKIAHINAKGRAIRANAAAEATATATRARAAAAATATAANVKNVLSAPPAAPLTPAAPPATDAASTSLAPPTDSPPPPTSPAPPPTSPADPTLKTTLDEASSLLLNSAVTPEMLLIALQGGYQNSMMDPFINAQLMEAHQLYNIINTLGYSIQTYNHRRLNL